MFNKYAISVRDFWTCQSCKKGPVPNNKVQIAHKIRQGSGSIAWVQGIYPELSKAYIEREIINHPFNVALTCSRYCNDMQNIFFNEVERDKLLEKITDQLGLRSPFV